MLCFFSANRAWVSRWYLGMDRHSTERGKAVKCSTRTNNTYFVVSAARGLKNIREVLLLKLRLLFVLRECLSQFGFTKSAVWMDVSAWWAVPWQFTVWKKESKKGENEGMVTRGKGEWDGKERGRVTEPCASKWEMKTQRGSVGVWGLEQGGLTKAIIIYSGMS